MWYGMVLYGMVCMYVCIYIYMWWTSVDYTLWSSHLVWMLENLPVSRSMIFLLRAGCQEHPPLSALVSDTGAAIVFRYPPAIKRGSEILNKWRFLAGKITHTHTYIHIYIYICGFSIATFSSVQLQVDSLWPLATWMVKRHLHQEHQLIWTPGLYSNLTRASN